MRFLDGATKIPSKSMLDVGAANALQMANFDEQMFFKRGGKYVWSKVDMKLEWWSDWSLTEIRAKYRLYILNDSLYHSQILSIYFNDLIDPAWSVLQYTLLQKQRTTVMLNGIAFFFVHRTTSCEQNLGLS